jgi:integrase
VAYAIFDTPAIRGIPGIKGLAQAGSEMVSPLAIATAQLLQVLLASAVLVAGRVSAHPSDLNTLTLGVDDDGLSVTKSHAERQVPLPPSLAEALAKHLEGGVDTEPAALVFTAPQGGALRLSAFYHRVWRPSLARLGLARVGVHVLRHSAAARMIAAGASPKAVQTVLGHASAAFTLTVYGHMFDADLDDLATRLDAPSRGLPRRERGLRSVSTIPDT